MEAYAVRWSPSRALCYAAVLAELCEEFGEETCIQVLLKREPINADRSSESSWNVARPAQAVCFGGGAAEIMAFGALLRYLHPASDTMTTQSVSVSGSTSPLSGSGSSPPSPLLDLHLVQAGQQVSGFQLALIKILVYQLLAS
jgi:25S rRNA (uracil2843-N3)-methyltransferase